MDNFKSFPLDPEQNKLIERLFPGLQETQNDFEFNLVPGVDDFDLDLINTQDFKKDCLDSKQWEKIYYFNTVGDLYEYDYFELDLVVRHKKNFFVFIDLDTCCSGGLNCCAQTLFVTLCKDGQKFYGLALEPDVRAKLIS